VSSVKILTVVFFFFTMAVVIPLKTPV